MSMKVMLGMSGGVDSSVAAALLQQQGYDVIGVTMKLWSDEAYAERRTGGGCCSLEDIGDARAVAHQLGIPHYVFNFQDVFYKTVVEDFVRQYRQGLTPNPCIACNRFVKFEELLRRALSVGCEYVATGHYARIRFDSESGRYRLSRSATSAKDQTYALYSMTQEQLSRTLMPLGDYTKEEIRTMAREFGLPVFDKPDSQEICFAEDDDYGSLVERRGGFLPQGHFVDTTGQILGTHRGIHRYTIGQRRGLGLARPEPVYVLAICPETNTVTVGAEHEQYLKGLTAADLNWIATDRLDGPMDAMVKIRYNSKPVPARVMPLQGHRVEVRFSDAQKAVAPGQAVVFYQGDDVLGGGTIERFSDENTDAGEGGQS